MGCDVEYTDEFESWWEGVSPDDQAVAGRVVDMLVRRGPALQHPCTSSVKSSRHGHMRELRVGTHPPIRIFYAFDPRRTAVLLIGGHKRHRADAIYDEYLREIRRERRQERDRTEEAAITMTGHRPWRKLFERTFIPEERDRIQADARKMLEEDDRRRGRPAGRTAPDSGEGARGAPRAETETRVAGARPVRGEGG